MICLRDSRSKTCAPSIRTRARSGESWKRSASRSPSAKARSPASSLRWKDLEGERSCADRALAAQPSAAWTWSWTSGSGAQLSGQRLALAVSVAFRGRQQTVDVETHQALVRLHGQPQRLVRALDRPERQVRVAPLCDRTQRLGIQARQSADLPDPKPAVMGLQV